MKLKVYKNSVRATIPEFQTEGAACFDLHVCLDQPTRAKAYNAWNKEFPLITKPQPINGNPSVTDWSIKIPPETRVAVPTGLTFDIPENYVMEVFIRSSAAFKKGLVLANGTGVIDSDYVDPLYVILHNVSDTLVILTNAERIAQARLVKTVPTTIEESQGTFAPKTNRTGGIGSTG